MNKKKSLCRKIVGGLEWAILIFSMCFMIYVLSETAKGKVAKIMGRSLLHIVTGSMEPTISVDDYVVVKKVNANTLKVGDIIAYYSEDPEIEGRIVIHRIVEITEKGRYRTKGDANQVPDDFLVSYDQIIGKYVRRSGIFNWISTFGNPKKLLLVVVVIPLFLMAVFETKNLAGAVKDSVKKKNGGMTAEEQELNDRIEELKKEAIKEYLKEKEEADKAAEANKVNSFWVGASGVKSAERSAKTISEAKIALEADKLWKEIEKDYDVEESPVKRDKTFWVQDGANSSIRAIGASFRGSKRALNEEKANEKDGSSEDKDNKELQNDIQNDANDDTNNDTKKSGVIEAGVAKNLVENLLNKSGTFWIGDEDSDEASNESAADDKAVEDAVKNENAAGKEKNAASDDVKNYGAAGKENIAMTDAKDEIKNS